MLRPVRLLAALALAAAAVAGAAPAHASTEKCGLATARAAVSATHLRMQLVGDSAVRVDPKSVDQVVCFDFTRDGRTDMAVYRASTGSWLILGSATGFATTRTVTLGSSADIPVPADYDGDGVTDIATYRPSAGQWSIVKSSDGSTLTSAWGTSGSDVPLPKHP